MAIIYNIDEALRNKTGFNVLQEPFKMLFDKEVEAYEKQSIIGKVFTTLKLDSFQERFQSKTTMDGFEPGADMEPAKLSDFDEGYDKVFRAVTWRNSFVVSKQAIEDNQKAQITADGMGFIESYGRTKEEFANKMISGALQGSIKIGNVKFDCTGMDTQDGSLDGQKQVYFHNAHKSPIDTSFTQSNKFYVNGGINLADGMAADKINSIIGQASQKMRNLKDYKKNPVPFNPNMIIMADDFLWKNAVIQALAKKNNATIVEIDEYTYKIGKWTVVTSPYLNELYGFGCGESLDGSSNPIIDQSFILLDTKKNALNKGFVWVDRVPLEITSRYEEQNEANIWKGRARYNIGFGDWRVACYVNCGTNPTSGATSNATELVPSDVPAGKPVEIVGDSAVDVNVTNPETSPVNTKEV